jgi:ribonucleotide reductase alpha subunit
LINLLYAGQIPQWDLTALRPAGAPLKTFGGRSSGPAPLNDLFKFTINIFRKAAGKKLTSIECHDIMCKIADVVVVGGVRRSALISLSNLSDDRMRGAKNGQWWVDDAHRALANNSAAYTEKPDIGAFMKEWLSLYDSKSGERGIVNRVAAIKKVKSLGDQRRKSNYDFGTNPCLHPDTLIETIHGRVKIKDITNPTKVYSMGEDGKLVIKESSASWISKKNAKTLKIVVASGKEIICTPDHKIFIEGRGWIEAQDIRIGDRTVHLVRNRRGACYSGVKLTTQDNRDYQMEHRLVFESYYGKIPEGYDIHHIDGNTYNNDIDNLECLSHEDHARITALEQNNDHMVQGSNGRFISPENSKHGKKTIVPMPEELKSNLHQYANVISISEGPVTDVYDMTVEGTHNFVANFIIVHNCGEIILRPNEFCNLTEVVVREQDTLETLLAKIEFATIMGTFQSTLTDFRYLRSIWKKNVEEERLLGVSLTGIMDHPILGYPSEESKNWFIALREHAVKVNKEWAEKLGIPASASITTVKPSGTVSQLVDSSSGIHPRMSRYYIRTVRNDKKDPLSDFLISQGVPHETDVMKDSNWVFSFPMKSPEHCRIASEMTAIDQLEHYLVVGEHFVEHNPSITVYVREHEWLEVGAWVYKHFDQINGVSFLPYNDTIYQQAPYQPMTKEAYDEMIKTFPEVDFDLYNVNEHEDKTTGTQELACVAGGCEI